MKKRRHIETDFIRFILEKYSNPEMEIEDIEEDEEIDNNDENEKKLDEDEEGEEEQDDTDEDKDEMIEKLLNEYKKVKKQYEGRRIQNKRK